MLLNHKVRAQLPLSTCVCTATQHTPMSSSTPLAWQNEGDKAPLWVNHNYDKYDHPTSLSLPPLSIYTTPHALSHPREAIPIKPQL